LQNDTILPVEVWFMKQCSRGNIY